MDRELAKHVVAVGFHSLALLEGLLPLLKEHCTTEEYEQYLGAVASVSATMTTELFNKVFGTFPNLETEVERKIERYGKFI